MSLLFGPSILTRLTPLCCIEVQSIRCSTSQILVLQNNRNDCSYCSNSSSVTPVPEATVGL